MLLGAGILAAFLASAQAQPPRSPVIAALAPSSAASVPLHDVIKGFDAPARQKALKALDELDRAPLTAADLAELGEAYRLLGRSDRAAEASRLRSAKDAETAGAAQEILALARSGDYANARIAAEDALRKNPRDPSLLAAYHQVKNRGAAAPNWAESSPEGAVAARESGNSPGDPRPFVLPIKAGKSGAPPSPASISEGAYLSPGTKKASDASLIWGSLWDIAAYKLDSEPPSEIKRMAVLRSKLDGTETGRALVADLGGWQAIGRDVDIRFAKVWNDGMGAYARPLMSPDSKGRKSALVLNTKLLSEPDSVVAPILAHELSHIRDFKNHSPEHGLAIPSEYAAHRTQIQVFEEMKAKMTPAEIADLKRSFRGQYQNFIALLWEDHLLRRFKGPQEMASAIGSEGRFEFEAKEVFRDLRGGKVGQGGPQLDYHLNGEAGGLYRILSSEKDIVDLIPEREAAGNYDGERRRRDKETLMKRTVLLEQSEKRDREFRAKHGFVIEAGK